MTRFAVAAFYLAIVTGVRGNVADVIARSDQFIIVIPDDKNSSSGKLETCERRPSGWACDSFSGLVSLGRRGAAWGVGLHRQPAAKREGDLRSPLGIFELEKIYGRDPVPPSAHFSYQQLTDTTVGVDDARSRYYNRIIDVAHVTARDWRSSEKLSPSRYRWLINVKHNWEQRPGLGSNIYLHATGRGGGTHGCTAMEPETLDYIVRWLDERKHPLLVQLTRSDYDRLRAAWGLP